MKKERHMKTRAAGIWFLALLLTGLAGFNSLAEEKVTPPAPAEAGTDEELEYTFGTVKSIADGQIVITEFDYDTGEEKEMTYAVDPKVELNNVKSLQEIQQGDEVDIDYRVEGEKKTAQVISVAKPLPVEEPKGGS